MQAYSFNSPRPLGSIYLYLSISSITLSLRVVFCVSQVHPAEDYEKLPAGTVEAHKVSEAGEERYVLDAIIGEAVGESRVGSSH